jgi:hypothetical protein
VRSLALGWLVALCACTPPAAPDVGLLGLGRLWPFPSAHLEGGDDDAQRRLEWSGTEAPRSVEGEHTELDLGRLERLDGFPVSTCMVVRLPGQAIGAEGLPGLDDLEASLAEDSPIWLVDLDARERIPFFAELDAYPGLAPEERTLILRPQHPLPAGGHVGVALTDAMASASGEPLRTPPRFAALRSGDQIPLDLAPRAEGYRQLIDALEAAGLARQRLLLAWDFHVASTDRSLAPFDRLLGLKREHMPPVPTWDPGFEVVQPGDRDWDDPVKDGAWRTGVVRFPFPHFVDGLGRVTLDEEGLPTLGASDLIEVQILVPESVRGAAAGTVPVLIFGHGILAHPADYLDAANDEGGTVELVNQLGMIAVGTEWRGLTRRDLLEVAAIAMDFGRLPTLTDRLLDGLTNALLMERLPSTAFAGLEIFSAVDGSGSMIDPEQLRYYGISLGGIEGTVLMANAERVPYGVLHLAGGAWSQMLERSSNWASLERLMVRGLPLARERQLAYAIMQSFWDPVDPVLHAAAGRLSGVSALWQMSMGDEQVPNFATEILLRAAQAPLITPAVHPAWNLASAAAPTPPGSAGLFQFDSGIAAPAPGNRPAEVSGAHTAIRTTAEHRAQVRAFFEAGAEGRIIAPCGAAPCVFDLGD